MRWSLSFVPLALLSQACVNGASSQLSHPEYAPTQAKCSVKTSQSEPLIVEWPQADRAKLEALTRQGLVAIHYDGCEMKVLAGCTVPDASYRYVATTLKVDNVSIQSSDELYARLPFGAARLEATLERTGRLDVDMSIVGRYQSTQPEISANRLVGRCAEATHVVSAVIVGAFHFSTAASAAAGGGVSVFDTGAGATSRAERESLSRDGDPVACRTAQVTDPSPPAACGALLRLEVTPLPEVERRLARESAERKRAYDDEASSASTRRTLGLVLLGSGVISGGLSGWFALRGAQNNEKIREGGFATAGDIEEAEEHGKTLDLWAYVFGGVGIALAGTGTTLVLTSPGPEPFVDSGRTTTPKFSASARWSLP